MMKTNLMTESEMVDEFLLQLSATALFVREVPVFAKSVDLVKIENYTISAIEFKTTKWRKAELQVLGSAIVFDYLEICVLKPATEACRGTIINECTLQGIGLYFLDKATKKLEHVVKPKHREGVWEIQRKQIINYLERRMENERKIQIN